MRSKFFLFVFAGVVLMGVLFAVSGQASANTQHKGIGQVEISGDYQVQVFYKLDEKQPDHLKSVSLGVDKPLGASDPSQIMISMDEGETWVNCQFSGGTDWTCKFQAGAAPNIEFIQNIRVMVS